MTSLSQLQSFTIYDNRQTTPLKALHTTKIFTMIHLKYRRVNRCPYIKLLKKIVAVVKKVVVCMDGNYFFAVSIVVCEGPYNVFDEINLRCLGLAGVSLYGPSSTWRAGCLDQVILLVRP